MSLRSGGWSAKDLANEAERKLGACPHVPNPQSPAIIYGCSVSAAVERAEAWAAQATTSAGGKYRKNQPCMAAGVFSCPREREDVWPDLRSRFVADLVHQHADRLLSVIEHNDEAHPHVHFYIVPRDGESFGVVHPGYAARSLFRSAARTGRLDVTPTPPGKKPRGAQYAVGAAFRSAMTNWQDGIYERVCRDFGFERLGPRRQRVSRDVKKQQQQQDELERSLAKFEALRRQADEDAQVALQLRQAAEAQMREAEARAQQVSIHERRARDALIAIKAMPEFRALETLHDERRARQKVEQEKAELLEEVERFRRQEEALKPLDGDSQ